IRKVQRECGRTAQTKEGSLSLQHYVHFFSLDAFRTLLHFIQSFNVVLQETLELGAGQKGFWTDFTPGTGSGLRSMGKVTFLKSPAVDVNSPEMVSILKESGYSLTQTETT